VLADQLDTPFLIHLKLPSESIWNVTGCAPDATSKLNAPVFHPRFLNAPFLDDVLPSWSI
jgi:hypothetical protein